MADTEDEKTLQPIIRMPTDVEVQVAFAAYVSAVGKVAHAWNYLHERLGHLFARIVGGRDRAITAAVWYSTYSDRSQREMLEAAIRASNDPAFARLPKTAKNDLLDLLDRIRDLGGNRDNAIHAPCVLTVGPNGTQMATSHLSGHRRAKNLVGKTLIDECDWIERYAQALSRFTVQATDALEYADATWPERSPTPDRKPKKVARPKSNRPSPK
jgi:hypothetical protein